jgi:integral membrane protein
MANIVGVLIIPLFIFTGLHYAKVGSFKVELAIFGVGHGYLYIVYLITAGFLALKARLHIPWILLMFVAGLVPGLTFVVEWLIVTRKIQPLMAAQDAATATEAGAGAGAGPTPEAPGVSPAAR